jgi:hypothetical protein
MLLYGHTFFWMGHATAKQLLMDVLQVAVKRDDIPESARKWVPGTGVFAPLADLVKGYKDAFDSRRDRKRRLQNHALVDDPGIKPIVDGDPIEASHELERATITVTEADRDLGQAERDSETNAASLLDLMPLDRCLSLIETHTGLLGEAEKKQETAREIVMALGDKEDATGPGTGALEVVLDRLRAHNPDRGCVINGAVPCLTPVVHFTDYMPTIEMQITAIKKEYQQAAERNTERDKAAAVLAEVDQQVAYHATQLRQANNYHAKRADLNDKTRSLGRSLAVYQAGKNEAAERLVEVRARQASLVETGAKLLQWVAVNTKSEAVQKEHEALEAAVAEAEDGVAVLGPNGVPAAALKHSLDAFHGALNKQLEYFKFSMFIEPDPWKINISNEDFGGQYVPFSFMSSGQRLWCQLAFQSALAQVSGLGFVAVDSLEAIVGRDRMLVTNQMLKLPNDQCIACMARGENEQRPALPGLQVVWLGD